MGGPFNLFGREFKRAVPNYIFQSLAATGTTLVVMLLFDIVAHAAIVAALGSTAFIIFAMPHSTTAQPRRVIGGHMVGLLVGTISYFTLVFPQAGNGPWAREFVFVAAGALSVGLSIFIMVATNTEHPPAAGTALGLVAHGWEYQRFVLVLGATLNIVSGPPRAQASALGPVLRF